MEASVRPPAIDLGLAVRPGNPGPWSGPIPFPCRMLCRCSGADCKSALLLFPSQEGRLAPHAKPDQGVGIQEQFHSMYSRKSSSGSSKSGDTQKVPGRSFHRPALARVGSVGTSSSSAFTLIFRCCHPSGSGRCRVPSGDGVKMAVKVLMAEYFTC